MRILGVILMWCLPRDAEEEPWKHGCKSYKECHDLCCTQVGSEVM